MNRPGTNHQSPQPGPRRMGAWLAIAWIACVVTSCERGPSPNGEDSTTVQSPAAVPPGPVEIPPLTSTQDAQGGLSISIDESSFADACRRLDLPAPPAVSDVEPDIYVHIHEAIERLAAEPDADHYAAVGCIYDGHSFYDRAAVCYGQAKRLNGSDFRWPYLLGRMLQENGHVEEAVVELELAAKLNGEDAATLARLGDSYLGLGRLDDAAAAYSRFATLRPAAAFGHFGVAKVAYQRGDLAGAAANLETALSCDPGLHQVLYLYGRTLARLGRREEAGEVLGRLPDQGAEDDLAFDDPLLRKVHLTSRSSRSMLNRLEDAAREGAWEEAIDVCQALLRRRPDDFNMMYNLATLYRQTNRLDQAEGILRHALAANPDHPSLNCGLAELLRSRGRPRDALVAIEKALAANPGFARAHAIKGLAHLDLGEWQHGEESFGKAVVLAPNRDDFLFYLAWAKEEQGRRDEAIDTFRRAIDLNPSNSRARKRLDNLLQGDSAP